MRARRPGADGQVPRGHSESLAQLALQWVLRQPQVTSALVGASSVRQLDHNVTALEFPPLTDKELALIDENTTHRNQDR
ncbi:aldo/keto reductase [Saccharopolyspora pogona]|uniref:aldo/keto reductase n=1 Tax=Saccharopolyspora pogona TaxID=333966 RepID=UPI001CC22040|nr:aldo/keto reductase [Saccharopolyspora pogona]